MPNLIETAARRGWDAWMRADDMTRQAEANQAQAVRALVGRLAPKLSLWERGAVARAPKVEGGSKIPLRGPVSPEAPARALRVGPLGSGADIEFKPEARLDGLTPEMTRLYPDVAETWRRHGAPRPVITSGNDGGMHRPGSRHYTNQAFDLRGNNLDSATADAIVADMRGRLGPDYDVLYERFPHRPANNHFHIEYDPPQAPVRR